LAAFYGIVVGVHSFDHPPPHVHVRYGEFTATLDVDTLEIRHGRLPRRARLLMLEWASLHRDELSSAFNLAATGGQPPTIDPLP
jgi:hypothetical protein